MNASRSTARRRDTLPPQFVHVPPCAPALWRGRRDDIVVHRRCDHHRSALFEARLKGVNNRRVWGRLVRGSNPVSNRAPEDLIGGGVEREASPRLELRRAEARCLHRHAVEAQLRHHLELRRVARLARLHEPPGLPQLVPLHPATVALQRRSDGGQRWRWPLYGGEVDALWQIGRALHSVLRDEPECSQRRAKDGRECSESCRFLSLAHSEHCGAVLQHRLAGGTHVCL